MSATAAPLFGTAEPAAAPAPWSTADADVPLATWRAAAARLAERTARCPDDAPAARPGLGGCWWWLGAVSSTGHGRATLTTGRQVGPHALVWVAAHNRLIPAGQVVRHLCDEPSCLRPGHLETGTQLDNIADCLARGRHRGGDTRGPAARARAARDHLLAHPGDWDGLAAVLAAGDQAAGLTPLPGL